MEPAINKNLMKNKLSCYKNKTIERIFKNFSRLFIFIRENKPLFLLFSLSCIYFIYCHLINIPWDFSAYILNAKYFFYNGDYFELYRAPITSLILSPLILMKRFGEIVYILLVSTLFLYSNIKLSDTLFKERKNISRKDLRFIFYFFSLSTFVLLYAFHTGSELLNLAFISLFLSSLFSDKKSGHFLGFAFLTRYNSLIFFPLILFHKNIKKIIKNVLLFLLVVFPWFLYNRLYYRNWFASFIESYTLNVYLRDYLFQKFNWVMLFPLIKVFLIFFIIGVIYSLILLINKPNKRYNYKIIIFYILGILILLEFSKIPLKFERYLFNFSLVVAFFSSLGSIFLLKRFPKIKKILLIFFLVFFIITFAGIFNSAIKNSYYNPPFREAAEDINSLNISECEILSPLWVPMNYLTENVRPLGRNDINQSINSRKAILIFPDEKTIDDLFDLEDIEDYPLIINKDKYVILGYPNLSNENCFKVTPYNQRFAEDPCEILDEKMQDFKLGKISKKICYIIN